jgi:hypothetical protein
LPQESFLDGTSTESESSDAEKRYVDIAAKVRVRHESALAQTSSELFFIIHVESQSALDENFRQRMFQYFSRLFDRYGLPIYPIALFTFDYPLAAQPTSFVINFLDHTVLDFRYEVVQLNRLNWRDFLRQSNPMASALMAKMRIAPADRLLVKLECLRLLATFRLDRGRGKLISSFVDEYLQLNRREQEQFRQLVSTLEPREQEGVMLTTTIWTEERAGI